MSKGEEMKSTQKRMDEVDEIIRAHEPRLGFWLVIWAMFMGALLLLTLFPFAPEP